MASGIVRLERFFSKRRTSSTPSTEPNSPVTPSEPQFPSPSFIRPKTSRMTARNESFLKQSEGSNALYALASLAASSNQTANTGPLAREPTGSEMPTLVRPASFDDGQCGSLFADSYQFPPPPKGQPEQLPLLESADLASLLDGFSSDCSESTRASQDGGRVSSPVNEESPAAGHEVAVQSNKNCLNKALPVIPNGGKERPESKLDTAPEAADWDMEDPADVAIVNTNLCEDIERHLGSVSPQRQLQHSTSDPVLSSADWRTPRSRWQNPVLWGPDFSDFMSLSDDDIAESDLRSPSIRAKFKGERSPTSASPAPTFDAPPISRPRSLLTLTPPFASKPTAAAAYEAARIAARYEFDLVYVVNLWPDSTRPRAPSIGRASPTRTGSTPYHMTGRLLAAYGLERVKSPFQITASVHTKVLRSQGWTEYRSLEARQDEFAQGYACSFFTGRYSRSNSVDSNMSSSTQSSHRSVDRGLVFAAYRIPKEDGSMRYSDEQELDAIRRDAEGLVEMLIDIHAAHRQRQAPLFTHQEETGPIPVKGSQSA